MKITKISAPGFEEIWQATDSRISFNAIIAIHNTKRGPSIGGVRFQKYASDQEALEDVKGLAEAMTYKAAVANLDHGGGKGVIIEPDGDYDRSAIYQRFAEFINQLKGRYISAKDAGTTGDDVAEMKRYSQWVGGAPSEAGGPGDPSPVTAFGVVVGIKVAVQEALKRDNLEGLRVAIQGLGSVGFELSQLLKEEGCEVCGSDIDPKRLMKVSGEGGIRSVLPEMILTQETDVLSPCALGHVLKKQSIPQLNARIVAGAANGQLTDASDAECLLERGILYAPDFVINAGGLIHVAAEIEGYDRKRVFKKTEAIGETLKEIFQLSKNQNISTCQAALEIAKERLR